MGRLIHVKYRANYFSIVLFTVAAYRMLSNPERREKYDVYGIADDQGFEYVDKALELDTFAVLYGHLMLVNVGTSMRPLGSRRTAWRIHS